MKHYADNDRFTRCNLMFNFEGLSTESLAVLERVMRGRMSDGDTRTGIMDEVECDDCRRGVLVDVTHTALNMQFFKQGPDGNLTIESELIDPERLSPFIQG